MKRCESAKGKTHFPSDFLEVRSVHVGCGDILAPGWLNIGLFQHSDRPYGEVIQDENGAYVINADVADGISRVVKEEACIEKIYASHFIEHIDFHEGIEFIADCYRVLKPGGILRVSFPDLEIWVKNYYEGRMDFFERYKSHFLKDRFSIAQTKGQIMMAQIHNWGHCWAYDFESMYQVMESAGFAKIRRCEVHESQIEDIVEVEPDCESRTMESCYVEATKSDRSC